MCVWNAMTWRGIKEIHTVPFFLCCLDHSSHWGMPADRNPLDTLLSWNNRVLADSSGSMEKSLVCLTIQGSVEKLLWIMLFDGMGNTSVFQTKLFQSSTTESPWQLILIGSPPDRFSREIKINELVNWNLQSQLKADFASVWRRVTGATCKCLCCLSRVYVGLGLLCLSQFVIFHACWSLIKSPCFTWSLW